MPFRCQATNNQREGGRTSIDSTLQQQHPITCLQSIKTNAMSIRVVTTLLCALIILITAVVVIAVTTEYSLTAAEDIAIDQASLIALKSKGDMETLMGLPLQYAHSWQYFMGAGSSLRALPSESTTDDIWFSNMCDRFVSPLAASNFLFQYSGMGFEDGTYVGIEKEQNETVKCSFFHWGNKSISSSNLTITTSTIPSTVTIVTYHRSNFSQIERWTSTSRYDPRARPWYNQVPHTKDAVSWSDVYLSIGPTLPAVDADAAIFNASGTFIGVVSLTFELSTVSGFLSEISNTVKKATLIVLDNQDLVVASSHTSSPFSSNTTVAIPYNGTLTSNCLLSDAANDAALNIIVCRSSAATFGFTPLNEMAESHADLLSSGTGAAPVQLKLDGTKYFVKVMHLETNPSTNWRVVLFLPSSVITHGVIKGRNMSIYICIAVVAATLIFCAIFVTLLLRPLHTLSERMYRAATMQGIDDDCDDFENSTNRKEVAAISYFQEISTIQLAFASLTSELSKVKGFLPQSVLEALYGIPSTDSNEHQGWGDETELIDEGFGFGDSVPSSPSHRLSFFQTSDGENNGLSNSANKNNNNNNNRIQATAAPSPMAGGSSSVVINGGNTFGSSSTILSNSNSNNVIRSSSGTNHHHLLNTGIGLKSKKVSVLMINICDYHQHLQNHTPAEIASGHSRIVKLIGDACTEQRGILDGFQGDRFVVSFNAVTTVVNHAHHAAKACASIAESFSSSRMLVSSGIGSGPALVGNIGSFSTKRFTVLSSVVSNAAALERLSKHYGPIYGSMNTIVSGNAAADIENFFELMTIDGVVLPSSTANGTRIRIAAIMGPKRASPGEWMYQLEEGAVKSEYTELNLAFIHLMKHDYPQAISAASSSLRKMSRGSESYLSSASVAAQSVVVPALNPLMEPSLIRGGGYGNNKMGTSDNQQQPHRWSVAHNSASHNNFISEGATNTTANSTPTNKSNSAAGGVRAFSESTNSSSPNDVTHHDRLLELKRKLLQGVVAAANNAIQNLRVSDVRTESLTGDPASFTSSNGDSIANNTTTTAPPPPLGSMATTSSSSIPALSLLGITDDFYGKCVLPALRAVTLPAAASCNGPAMSAQQGAVGGVRVGCIPTGGRRSSASRAVGGLVISSSYNSTTQSRATTPPLIAPPPSSSFKQHAVVTATTVNKTTTVPFRSLGAAENDEDAATGGVSSDYDQNIQDIALRCGL